MKKEIKPCPFCGNKEAPRIITRHGKDGWRDRFYVVCAWEDGGCGSASGWYYKKEEAASCWNRRAKWE